MKRVKRLIIAYIVFIIILVAISVVYKDNLQPLFDEPEKVEIFVANFGIWGPIILILLQVFQVVIFFVPGQIFTIAGGFMFGLWKGTLYSLIGTILGSILVFYFSRKLGRPFVERIMSKETLKKLDKYFVKKGRPGLVVSRMIPLLFPIDAISIAAGLTKISYKDFIIFSTIGLIPNIFLLTFFGSQISKGITPMILICLSILGIIALLYIFRELLSNSIVKLERFIEDTIHHTGQKKEKKK